MRLPVLAASSLVLLVAACASNDAAETAAPALVGGSPDDVNWTFEDVNAMEAKLAGLRQDNARLQRRVMELQRRLDEANAAPRAAEPQAPPPSPTPIAARRPEPPPARAPVIEPPALEEEVRSAAAPADRAPRLVSPAFADAGAVFENEAAGGDFDMQSVLWGVHLDSYRRGEDAAEGWVRLQRTYPDELGLLEARLQDVTIEGQGEFLRLVAGGFAAEDKAKALCVRMSAKGQYCRVVDFGGARLALGRPS